MAKYYVPPCRKFIGGIMKKEDNSVNALIAYRLKLIREQKGISRLKLKEISGYNVRQIERYEMNRSRIPADYIADFCKILNISPATIYSSIVNETRLFSAQETELIHLLEGLDITPIVRFLKNKKGF